MALIMSTSINKESNISTKHKKLGDLLVHTGLINHKVLEKALEIQKTQKRKIGQILIEMGVVDDMQIAKALANQLKVPLVRLNNVEIPEKIISLVPQYLAETYTLIPVKQVKNKLVVAMVNPLEFNALDDLRFCTQMPVFVTVAPQSDILDAIGRYYQQNLDIVLGTDYDFTEHVEIINQAKEIDHNVQELIKLTELPQMVRFTNTILSDAVKLKASDIHIEPQKDNMIIRYKVDGVMQEIMQTNKQVHLTLVTRIKIMSGLNISIHREPQNGSAQVKIGSKIYNLIVTITPTTYGEKATIRILSPSVGDLRIENLGFSEKHLKHFQDVITKPHGMILVTGPTGSGKSSTLYTILKKLNTPNVKIMTVEDPVEIDIDGITQVQINPKAGITFANGLKSILGQHPDIVMIGEIRDNETASIAFQAAQPAEGHLVLSTLHASDASSAVIHLLNMGVDSSVLGDSLLAVVGQRLVRRICEKCKEIDPLTPQIFEQLPKTAKPDYNSTFWKGTGCETCQYTGYVGQQGIFELLMITPAIKESLDRNTTAVAIREIAEKEGFTTLAMDGILKSFQGHTTIEEVFRVAPPEDDDSAQESLDAAVTENRLVAQSPQAKIPSPITSVNPYKILIADDNPVILKILQNVLEANNYLVITAFNGLEALKIAHKEKPALIITDYLMPEMNGIALVTKLRSQPVTRHIPVIMLTSIAEIDTEVEVLNAGADDYLIKPPNARVLVARIGRLLNRTIQILESE